MSRSFKPNEYRVLGDVATLLVSRKGITHEIKIDASKLPEVLAAGRWHVFLDPIGKRFYALAHSRPDHKSIYLHRFLAGFPAGKKVDHIDHDGLNNTSANLRVISHAANLLNRSRSNSNSGIQGVTWYPRLNKWRARVGNQYLGYFTDKNEAASVALAERERLIQESANG